MKITVLVGFLLLGLVYSLPVNDNKLEKMDNSSEEDLEEVIKTIQEYVDKKCKTGNAVTKNVTEILMGIYNCLDDHVPNTAEELKNMVNQEQSEEICQDADKIHKVRECFQTAIDLWKDCSDPQEQYIPDFLFDAVENTYKFICDNDGKNIEKAFQNSTLECVGIISEDDSALSVCDDRLESFGVNDIDDILTKTEMCRGLSESKICYVDYIKKKCPNDSNLRELIEGLVNSITASCTK